MYIENIGEHLKLHEIKPSYQRMQVYEYLLNNKTHPTVDEIYKTLSKTIPTLSKTTVYNTLNLFIEKGIAQVITIEENETRYDADTNIHGHFKCNCCKKVIDLDLDLSKEVQNKVKNYKIYEYHFYMKGICKECQDKK